MAKFILTLDDTHLGEYVLTKVRTTIGRKPSNDIHLDNLAVSGEHAVIVKIGRDYFVEDLDSTNGTRVNNQMTKRKLLSQNDIVELGKFHLRFINEASSANTAPAFEKTMLVRPDAYETKVSAAVALAGAGEKQSTAPVGGAIQVPVSQEPVAQPARIGRIQVLNGSSSGRELVLNKALTTLGKTGVQVAVITKRPNGYFITHVEGKVLPIVNGVSTGAQAVALNDHDIIELAGVKMEFYLS